MRRAGSDTRERRRRELATNAPSTPARADRLLATTAAIVAGAAIACVSFAVRPAGPLGWSYDVLFLWLLLAAAAGRALLGSLPPLDKTGPALLGRAAAYVVPLVAFSAALPYLHSLSVGFLSDDFGLARAAHEAAGPADVIRFRPYVLFYRPLSELVWWTGVQLWGGAALGYHLLNLAIHILNSLLVCSLAARLAGNRYAAFTAGLIFAVHPIHVEPVVWAACLPDLLSAGLSLLSLLMLESYLRARSRRGRGLSLFAALAAFGLALFSKESSAALPGVVVLRLVLASNSVTRRRALGVGGCYAVVLMMYLAWRMTVLGRIGGSDVPITLWNTLFPLAPLRSIALFFFPINRLVVLDTVEPVLLGAMVVLMAAGLLWAVRGLGYVPSGRLWLYLGYVVVMSAPVWIMASTISAENMEGSRLAYLPTVGLAWLFGDICAGRRAAGRAGLPVPAAIVIAAAVLTAWYVVPWKEADVVARDVVRAGRRLVVELPAHEQPPVLYVRGLPDGHRGAQIFRNGFEAALNKAGGRAVLVRTVAPRKHPSDIPAEVLDLSQLLPGEYEVAWRDESGEMLVLRAGGSPTSDIDTRDMHP